MRKEKKENRYLKNARAIKKWMEDKNTTNPPKAQSKDKEEKRLGQALATIRNQLIKTYNMLKTEEERKKYKGKRLYLEEVLEIVEEIDKNKVNAYLKNARAIKKWMEGKKTVKPPRTCSKNKEEKRLGRALVSIRRQVIKPYGMLNTEEERKAYKRKYPYFEEVLKIIEEIDENNIHPYLKNAREIKKWMEKRNTKRPPVYGSKDEEERRLHDALENIRNKVITPYIKLHTEAERTAYKEKHPYIEEVLEIVKEIDENNINTYLGKAIAIKKWMEDKNAKKAPSYCSKDREEKKLARAFTKIREFLIKPYNMLKTEDERKTYKEKHPYIEEILEIVKEIDVPTFLRNARAIKKWMEEKNTSRPPSSQVEEKEEKKLGQDLYLIRRRLIKPYLELNTEEEKKLFVEKHPYFYEVLEIVNEIDLYGPNKNKQALARLIKIDLEKRKKLEEAKKLEKKYEEEINKKGNIKT